MSLPTFCKKVKLEKPAIFDSYGGGSAEIQ